MGKERQCLFTVNGISINAMFSYCCLPAASNTTCIYKNNIKVHNATIKYS